MTPKQLQKWSAIRVKGQQRYLISRMLLWGSILSVFNLARHYLISHYFAEPFANITVMLLFGGEPQTSQERFDFTFFKSSLRDIAMSLFAAMAIAFIYWSWKERKYAEAQQPQQT